MKKTLIALAVLAASGASFAQVAITGSVAMGYKETSSVAGAKAGGLGVDGSAVTFSASEDIGGGLKATASLGLDGMNRGAVGGADTSIGLQGGFGRLTIATAQGSDYLSGGVAGVAGIGLDSLLLSGLVATDAVAYALPAFGPVTVSFAHEEAHDSGGYTTANGAGFGIGGAGASDAGFQRRNGVSIAYSAGALKANATYRSYDRNEVALNSAKNNVSQIRAAVSYDLGAAVIGAGFDQRQLQTGTRMDTLVGLSVPMGALTFGVQFAQRTHADLSAAAITGAGTSGTVNGTQSSTGLKAAYALSKRTSLAYTYVKFEDRVLVGTNEAATQQTVLMSHSF